jgi:hypothetical protein
VRSHAVRAPSEVISALKAQSARSELKRDPPRPRKERHALVGTRVTPERTLHPACMAHRDRTVYTKNCTASPEQTTKAHPGNPSYARVPCEPPSRCQAPLKALSAQPGRARDPPRPLQERDALIGTRGTPGKTPRPACTAQRDQTVYARPKRPCSSAQPGSPRPP